jgi:L-amino acid N-acyltransferase YncA
VKKLIIRRALPRDARGIAKVHVDSWQMTYKSVFSENYLQSITYESREELWTRAIPNGYVFVAENDQGEIIGFSSGGKERTGNYPKYNGELYAIYILQNDQGKGIGRQLVNSLIEELKSDGIHSMIVLVLEENPSKHFYETLGAFEIDRLEDTVAGKEVIELVYGWKDFSQIYN